MPEGEHTAERVADHRNVVQAERVHEVVKQPMGVFTDATAPVADGIRQPVSWEIDRQQPEVSKFGEQRSPRRG
jgi:hypothetical protein